MKDKYKRVTTLSLATFLLLKGQQVAGINPTDVASQKEFAFVNTDTLEELVHTYRFAPIGDPCLLVDIKLYEQARNELLSALKDYK